MVVRACNGINIDADSVEDIGRVLDINPVIIFDFFTDETLLSNRAIRDYRQFVSTVLPDAEKEMLIPYNPASKARPPKLGEHTPNYLQINDVDRILEALENEPIKGER